MRPIFKISMLSAVTLLSACSFLQSDKVDYQSTVKTQPLAVPPDLTQLSKDARYTMVDGGVSAASGNKQGSTTAAKPQVAATAIGDIRVERAGNQRWLVVKRPADTLWEPLKAFWKDSGFTLVTAQSDIGIMETDWAENRAKLPQDFIRATLGRLIDSLYSTSERDKYRTRLESNASGETEIFISHRGLQEVEGKDGRGWTWQARPSDPELEAEFLRKLMVHLGASQPEADAVAVAKSTKPSLTISNQNGVHSLVIPADFDRAWRRVGLALDRTGFTVEDRDRKQGLYFVRYVASTAQAKEKGFFDRLFSTTPKIGEATKFQIQIKTQGESSVVTVLSETGAPDTSASAQKIVERLAEDLR